MTRIRWPSGRESKEARRSPSASRSSLTRSGRRPAGRRSRNARGHCLRATAATPPDADEVTRVWCPRDPGALRSRLANAALAVWAEDDVLHVLWRGHAEQVHLASGAQVPMWPVPGSDDLWEASLRTPRLAEAVISISVLPQQADELLFGRQMSDHMVWRGPRAPTPLPAADSVTPGVIEGHS